jgi:hypothetical protein
MQMPLVFFDRAVIEEVPLDGWKDLFDAVGWPQSLTGSRNILTHDGIWQALQTDTLSDEFLQALETLQGLGTQTGREAIVGAMQDRHVPLDSLPPNVGEREFALRLYLAQRSDANLADIYERAQTQVQDESEHRRYNEFMGKKAQPIANLKLRKQALKDEILRHCRESDLGEHVDVHAFEDNGTYVFNILRSHHTRKPLALVPGHSARATIQFRPIHGDMVRYESHVGRLRMALRAASMVDVYRVVLGKALFDDPTFFEGEPVCSLKVLQERGRAALEHEVFGVGRIWMTECLWEQGDRNQVQIRSTDCFRAMEEMGLRPTEGTFLLAKLKVQVVQKSTRPITVTIRVPSRIEITKKAHENLIDEVLSALGIRNPPRTSAAVDIWSLYPWRQSVAVWRQVLGPRLDGLVEQGVLAPIRLASVVPAEQPSAGRALQAHALAEGDFYAPSQMPEIPSRSLSATDLDGLQLIPEQLRVHLRSMLGIQIDGSEWQEGNELLDVGTSEVGGQRFYFVYALRNPISGVGDSIRTRANGAHVVLLNPTGQTVHSDLASIMLGVVFPARATAVIRSAIITCGVANLLPALYTAPDGARLVVDTHFKKIWVDGVEIRGLTPDSHPFRFVEMMARGGSAPVSSESLCTHLSPARDDDSTTARQAKNAAKKSIQESMAAANHEVEDPFPSAGKGFYRCILPAHVR